MPKKKTTSRKTTTKRTMTKAAKSTAASRSVRTAAKVNDTASQNCKAPTTLFEVEFPTTVLFWAGVALFFLFILLIAQSVMG